MPYCVVVDSPANSSKRTVIILPSMHVFCQNGQTPGRKSSLTKCTRRIITSLKTMGLARVWAKFYPLGLFRASNRDSGPGWTSTVLVKCLGRSAQLPSIQLKWLYGKEQFHRDHALLDNSSYGDKSGEIACLEAPQITWMIASSSIIPRFRCQAKH